MPGLDRSCLSTSRRPAAQRRVAGAVVAAAVLPFIIYLSTLGNQSVLYGLGALMVGLLVLMIVVTGIVGLGRQVAINFLRRATGTIKLVGAWMMMFAGIMLTIYLTNPELTTLIL